jgi:hypothetical protein
MADKDTNKLLRASKVQIYKGLRVAVAMSAHLSPVARETVKQLAMGFRREYVATEPTLENMQDGLEVLFDNIRVAITEKPRAVDPSLVTEMRGLFFACREHLAMRTSAGLVYPYRMGSQTASFGKGTLAEYRERQDKRLKAETRMGGIMPSLAPP